MNLKIISLGAAITFCSFGALAAPATAQLTAEQARWADSAKRVTIMRDNWGVPHVFGKSDADAVFGLMFAQAEDDFNRVEHNYIKALGRLSEVDGETELWRDLRTRLYNRPAAMKAKYAASPAWMKKLMIAFADGLNYYLHTHPNVKPRLITHFEPWMPLAFSEGSISAEIERIDLKELENFYGKQQLMASLDNGFDPEPSGSNGFAIAPKLSKSGHALLLINPHTSFYFRTEVHMVSEEGLNAYGALTWGQFFIYQGFNERAGWMHTTGGGDGVDEYLETVDVRNGKVFYKYGNGEREMRAVPVTIPYKTATGMANRTITTYFSHHGPVVRAANGKWITVKMLEEPLNALIQSYSRTKITNYKAFLKNMGLRTNSSNNTTYADADGNIAYFNGNFIPKRNPAFNFTQPVDGANPATEWQGLHAVGETIMVKNPATGWIQNTNNWPFSVSGAASPLKKDYPKYMWVLPENARGLNAVRVLEQAKDVTLDSLIAAAHDNYLKAFEALVPTLLKAYDELPPADPQKTALTSQVAALRGWDLRFSLESVPTSLAVYWGQEMVRTSSSAARAADVNVIDYITNSITPAERLQALSRASAKLESDFGSWQTPWGEINRFQRTNGDITQRYDDSQPSIPVAFPSGVWGSLAAYGTAVQQTTKRLYGDRGNSFVAAVEFGPRVKAKSILVGGSSGNPASPHFRDQAAMYAKGQFKDVLFYPADIEKHLERKYHPGQ